MRRRRFTRAGRSRLPSEGRFDRLVVMGLVIAGFLLVTLDSPAAMTNQTAWAVSNRFESTEMALPEFLRNYGPGGATHLTALPLIRRSADSAWGGRLAELDFSPERSEASVEYSPKSEPQAVRRVLLEEGETQGDARVTSGFGFRRLGGTIRHHDGIDLSMPYGAPINAHEAGLVVFAGWRNGYGYCVIIDHGSGKETLYAHASVLRVRAGETVRKGELIAHVGNTGRAFGAHLHFEIRHHGVPVDPEREYIEAAAESAPPASLEEAAS